MIAATIDIGTNTALLLVADYDGQSLKILHDEARITRLGEGLHKQPRFLPAAQERVFHVLKEYRSTADALGARKITAVGTAAFRKAENAAEFLARVRSETGIEIKIISGEEEARLSYLSVKRDFGKMHNNLVALDIGGGSTEIISKNVTVSLPLGAVVLSESIIHNDPPTDGEIKTLTNKIDQVLNSSLRPKPYPLNPVLIGLAGSVTTLSAIKQKLISWDGAKVQGSILALTDIDEMIALFQKTTNREKSEIPGMVKGREDTILTGTLILKGVMRHVGIDRVIVSDRGLRFGLIYATE